MTEQPSPGPTDGRGSLLSYRVREAVASVRARGGPRPRVGLVLGSGLGGLADEISAPVVIRYEDIPHFPVSSVQGHAGRLVLGELTGVPVVAMRGRSHFYEGHSLEQVTFPVRVMHGLGAETLVITNAAGGLTSGLAVGDLLLIRDHINLMGMVGNNPLVGLDEAGAGARFLDLVGAYDDDLLRIAREVAEGEGEHPREGVYAIVAGPSFETRAEIRFLQLIGADAVGMSTVPEVIVARQEGMRVLAISVITNVAQGTRAATAISHSEVLTVAARVAPRLSALVRGVLERLG